MAYPTFPAEVLTPEGEAFSGEVEMVSTRTGIGSIGIRANHAPLMALLEPTELRVYTSESDVMSFAQAEGYLQVLENSVLVLVEEAIPPDDLDRSELETRLREAKEELFNLRFQVATGQLDNNARLRTVRRDIARIYTVMRERELGIYVAAGAGDQGAA